MAKMLKFGGPSLTEGFLTWFQRFDPATGMCHEVIRVRPGDVVPAELVGKATGEAYVDKNGDPAAAAIAVVIRPDGSRVIKPGYFHVGELGLQNADYYVETGRAVYVDVPDATQSTKG